MFELQRYAIFLLQLLGDTEVHLIPERVPSLGTRTVCQRLWTSPRVPTGAVRLPVEWQHVRQAKGARECQFSDGLSEKLTTFACDVSANRLDCLNRVELLHEAVICQSADGLSEAFVLMPKR